MIYKLIAAAVLIAGIAWFSKWFTDLHKQLFEDVKRYYRENEKDVQQIVIKLPDKPSPIYDDLLIALEEFLKNKGLK